MGLLDGFFSLGANINKVKTGDMKDTAEGIVSDQLPEMELKKSDDELIQLANQWERNWQQDKGKLDTIFKMNKEYWLGAPENQPNDLMRTRPLADNLIFQSVETFLPMVTKAKPDPVVEGDNTPEGNKLAKDMQRMLTYQADIQHFKLKLKQAVRNWSLFRVGVIKVGWSEVKGDIMTKVIRPQKLILDPDCSIEDCEYTGEYLGEYKAETANRLIKRFPKKEKEIREMVHDKLGTKLQYIEWHTDEFIFWKLNNIILDKIKTPHWNYEGDGITWNHFAQPKMPYIFLSVFNLGEKPYDDTSIIEQNLALQDLINKRLKQIDKNADNINGGLVVSGDFFSKEDAARAAMALRRGDAVWVPSGDVNRAYKRDVGQALPPFVYESLQDYRSELRDIFGVKGLTPAGIASERTVRGKIISAGQDSQRAGGMISEYIEQFADSIFNWWVQLMCVYYDEPHYASVIGEKASQERTMIQNTKLNMKLLVSIKEGSMVPKDDMTRRNEAIDLWNAKAIDPITLYEKLEYPNPTEAAYKLFLWMTNPAALFGMQPPQVPGMQMPQPGQGTVIEGQPPNVVPQPGVQDMNAQGRQMVGQGYVEQVSSDLIKSMPLGK